MKLNAIYSLAFAALFSVFAPAFSMEHTSLRLSKPGSGITKIGLFVEGFTPESVFRTKMTIKSGLEGAEVVDLSLKDIMSISSTDIQMFVTPSEAAAGSEDVVKEGMLFLSKLVHKGSLLFSQLDSSSQLCKEFDYNGVKTVNSNFIFDGTCTGPVTKIGPMETECRAVMAHVDSRVRMIIYNNLYINGGFIFDGAESQQKCKILASITPRENSDTLIEFRRNADSKAVVIVCKHGDGAAILSGLQLDQNAAFLESHVKKHPEHAHVKAVSDHLSDITDLSSTLLHFMAMMKVIASTE